MEDFYDKMYTLEELDEMTKEMKFIRYPFMREDYHEYTKSEHVHSITVPQFMDDIYLRDISKMLNYMKTRVFRKAKKKKNRTGTVYTERKHSKIMITAIYMVYVKTLLRVLLNVLINGDGLLFANGVMLMYVRDHLRKYSDYIIKYRYKYKLKGFDAVLNVAIGRGFWYYKGKTVFKTKNLFFVSGVLKQIRKIVDYRFINEGQRYSKKRIVVYRKDIHGKLTYNG